MKRGMACAAAAASVAAVAGGLALAAGAPGPAVRPVASSAAAPAQAGVEVLTYLDVRTDTRFVDVGPQGGGAGPGDAYYFASALRHVSKEDGITRQRLGELVSSCTFLIGTRAKCSGSLLLADGTIEIAGTPDLGSSGPITAVVVGGSGRYLGGWGVATITPTRDDGVSRLVVRLGRRH